MVLWRERESGGETFNSMFCVEDRRLAENLRINLPACIRCPKKGAENKGPDSPGTGKSTKATRSGGRAVTSYTPLDAAHAGLCKRESEGCSNYTCRVLTSSVLLHAMHNPQWLWPWWLCPRWLCPRWRWLRRAMWHTVVPVCCFTDMLCSPG